MSKIPEVIKSNEEQMTEVEKRRNQLRQLQSSWDDLERMEKTELPELTSELTILNSQRAEVAASQVDVNSACLLIFRFAQK